MRLLEIIARVETKNPSNQSLLDLEINSLSYDSRQVKKGTLFFAIPGFTRDGHTFVSAAFSSGALAAIVSDLSLVPREFHSRCVCVKDVRRALAQASCNFYHHPSREMLVIGVTGTKGKTSTTFLLESIFRAAGKKTALLGTVLCRHPGIEFHSERTTMESVELQYFLREARSAGAEVAILEVSSHALSLDRVYGIAFAGMGFTNLTEDHLDFYGDMETYFQAKRLLFTNYSLPNNGKAPVGVIAADTEYGRRLQKESSIHILSCGLKSGAYSGADLQFSAAGIRGDIHMPSGEKLPITSPLTGEFNAQNILVAATLATALGITPAEVSKGIAALTGIPGRLERVVTSLPFAVFVDFAHMGAALENVLRALRPICRGKIILVFGAGGDRDPQRRVQLGTVAAKLADYSWITSDNPRTEDPQKIIATIEAAFQSIRGKEFYSVEADRRQAIAKSLKMAAAGDVVCIAGKGHETGQIIGKQEFPFDDRLEAAQILRQLEVDFEAKKSRG